MVKDFQLYESEDVDEADVQQKKLIAQQQRQTEEVKKKLGYTFVSQRPNFVDVTVSFAHDMVIEQFPIRIDELLTKEKGMVYEWKPNYSKTIFYVPKLYTQLQELTMRNLLMQKS